jgi:hypothetical protein
VHREDDRAKRRHRSPRALDERQAAEVAVQTFQLSDQEVRAVLLDQRERLGRLRRLTDDANLDPSKDLLDCVEPHRMGVADDSDLL